MKKWKGRQTIDTDIKIILQRGRFERETAKERPSKNNREDNFTRMVEKPNMREKQRYRERVREKWNVEEVELKAKIKLRELSECSGNATTVWQGQAVTR